jgi:Fibrinogen beta and gamma chains, C-terminal globular domain
MLYHNVVSLQGYTAVYSSIQLNVTNCTPVTVLSVFNWIIVHNRPRGSNFNYTTVNWTMASYGYGPVGNGSDFWLGLERMHQMTSANSYRLRFELQQMSTGRWYSVEYWWFSIGDGTVNQYRIQVDG